MAGEGASNAGGGKGRGGGREEMENHYYCFLANVGRYAKVIKPYHEKKILPCQSFCQKSLFINKCFQVFQIMRACPRISAALQICACLLTLARWLM